MKIVEINLVKEFKLLFYMFVFFNVLNVVSIFYYQTSWSEIYSQWKFIVVLTLVSDLIYFVLRIIIGSIRRFKDERFPV